MKLRNLVGMLGEPRVASRTVIAKPIEAVGLPPVLPLVILCVVLCLTSCASEQGRILEAHSLDEAKALAIEHDAVILVDFWKRH